MRLQHPAGLVDKDNVLALSIRQPFAELILRGIKTVEYRTRSTRIVGERFWIYAAKGTKGRRETQGSGFRVRGSGLETGNRQRATDGDEATKRRSDGATEGGEIWSKDLAGVGKALPAWMIELAEQVGMIEPGAVLPSGVIVGSAVIEKVSQIDSMYRWHLTDVERAKELRKPTGQPQPVWFKPF